MRKATISLVLVAVLAWCCLLFGIGLDDLTDGHTRAGVIFSVVTLSLLIAALIYAGWRLLLPRLVRHLAKS
jgi:hypothetical protein